MTEDGVKTGRPRPKDDVRVFKSMTLKEPVAKIARRSSEPME